MEMTFFGKDRIRPRTTGRCIQAPSTFPPDFKPSARDLAKLMSLLASVSSSAEGGGQRGSSLECFFQA